MSCWLGKFFAAGFVDHYITRISVVMIGKCPLGFRSLPPWADKSTAMVFREC